MAEVWVTRTLRIKESTDRELHHRYTTYKMKHQEGTWDDFINGLLYPEVGRI